MAKMEVFQKSINQQTAIIVLYYNYTTKPTNNIKKALNIKN